MKSYETKLGKIEIEKNKILDFEYGIPGFENLKKFTLITKDEKNPIVWLLSLEDNNIAFPVINPFIIVKDYDVFIPEDVVEYLGLKKEDDALILCILTLREKKEDITINLAAPIIISLNKNKGIQLINDTHDYKTREKLITLLNSNKVDD